MNIAPFLAKACQELDKAMQGTLDGTKIACISETISGYAIAAAVASGVAGVAPGFAGVAAALTQAGFVWATYVKINKTLDISMSENTVKFIGSAIVTNLITNAGAFVAVLVGSSILSIIPGVGTAAAIALNAALGYTIVYVSAIIYLKLITRMMQPDGTLKVSESDDTKHIIRNIIKESNIKDMVKEGKVAYKQAKKDGSLDKAKKAKTCPKCGAEVKEGQRFCSECGANCKIQTMTDQEIISSLIAHDPKVTAQFFFKDCRPLFLSVIRRVFGTQIVDYDEIISELYILLMENDAKKLRSFKFESTLYQWLKTTAIRHCLLLKSKAKVIDDESQEPLNNSHRELSLAESSQARMDMETLLRQMKNQRYALVIRLLMIEDKTPEDVARQLCVTVDNLYNIKRRAIQALTEVALKDKKHYER